MREDEFHEEIKVQIKAKAYKEKENIDVKHEEQSIEETEFSNEQLLKKLKERESSLLKKKNEISRLISTLEKEVDLLKEKSGDFRLNKKLTVARSEVIKTIATLHKMDSEIDSELMKMYLKMVDRNDRKKIIEEENAEPSRGIFDMLLQSLPNQSADIYPDSEQESNSEEQ